MSGDVQPRKRKDKKKKRDDSDVKAAELFARKMSLRDDDEAKEKSPPGVHATKMGPDDIQLHVHSDHGTGGHWCAKVLFFSLMAVLLGLIGLILLENRGISDLDTPLSESRFADYLEGWVEEKRESHDEHDVLHSLNELDDHDHDNEPFAEEEDHDEADDHDDEADDHDEAEDHDENDDGHDEEEDEDEPQLAEENDDGDENQNDDGDDNQNDDGDDNQNDDGDDNQNDDGDDNQNDDGDDNQNDDGDDNDNDTRNENDNDNDNDNDKDDDNENTKDNDDEKDDKDEGFEDQLTDDNIDDDDNRPFEEHDSKANIGLNLNSTKNFTYVSAEELEKQVDELYANFNTLAESLNITKIDADDDINIGNAAQLKEDDDDDDGSKEEFIDNDKGEDLHLQKATENQSEDETQEESSSLTVKLGVGVALVVVAHLVLVKRSKSNEAENIETSPIEPDLKRRFTIVTSAEPIPSDVDDEQPNDDEDDLKDGYENEVRDENIDILDDDEIEEYENEDVEYEDDEEVEDDEEDIEHVEDVEDAVDTFTEMSNMYRPKNDNNVTKVSPKPIVTDTEVVVINNKNVDTKPVVKDVQVPVDEEEYDEDEDLEGSEGSEDIGDDEEDEEEDEEEISDVDDVDLMKRLESKYGKLEIPENKSSDEEEIEEKWTKVKRSGPQYNDDDFEDELRRTNDMLDDNPTSALKSFEFLIEIKPNSSKAWYGKGKALDVLSEEQKSNEILKEAIVAYNKAVEFGSSVDDETFKIYAERCIDRMRFIGQHLKAVPVHETLIARFNDDPYYRNQLAVTYLLINRLADAKLVLHGILLKWRNNGFALVHYGFVLKNLDKNNEAAVAFLQQGIDSEAEGTNDGRFYFNLGEALTRLGRNDEAMAVYRKGASKKLFLSEYQRSLYNVDRLQSRPFWTKKATGYKRLFDVLEQNWEKIRDEGLNVLNNKGHFTDESENLRDIGDWKQFDLFARGRKMVKHCEKTPFTCKIIETFPAARFCKRGQVKFSVMHPGTHVWPHCGPTNCRIRAHLGLKVPEKTFIRVATETRSWKEGQLLIFDDSFEHEVWHNGTTVRLVLIVDVWHPDLTEEERTNLFPI